MCFFPIIALEDRSLGLSQCFKLPSHQPFGLHLPPKGLHGCVVPAIALARHTAYKAVRFKVSLVVARAVLATTA